MELIQVSNTVAVGTTLIPTVNARELHGFLGNGKQYTDWIRERIQKYGFIDGVDYTTVMVSPESEAKVRGGNRRATKDYHITVGMAKELAMVERNDQGKKARLYFIECEKRLTEIAPASTLPSYPEALRKLADTLERNTQQAIQIAQQTTLIETQKPAVEFVDKYVEAKDLKTFRTVAKLLGVNEREFRNFLVDRGYNFRQDGKWVHAKRCGPTGTGWFDLKTVINSEGKVFEQSRFTPKGVVAISQRWNDRVPVLTRKSVLSKDIAKLAA